MKGAIGIEDHGRSKDQYQEYLVAVESCGRKDVVFVAWEPWIRN